MKKVFSVLAYTVLFGVIFVIVFVRTPNSGGQSGGQQASQIINASGGALSSIINALTGK